MKQLENYCRIEGEMTLKIQSPAALSYDTTPADIASGILRRAAKEIDNRPEFELETATFSRREGLILNLKRRIDEIAVE